MASRTTLIVALLFYFGWASARATYSYFGIDTSLLGFSTSDYLLRSVYSAYQPILLVGLGALVAVGVHQTLLRLQSASAPSWLRRIPVIALAVAVVLVTTGIVGLADPPFGRSLRSWLPALLAAGALAGAYANHTWPLLRPRWPPADPDPSPDQRGADDDRQLREFLLLGLALLGLFWWTGLFATSNGHHRAQSIERDLASATAIRIYAKHSLSLPASCAQSTVLPPAETYRYRYTDLRLLVHSGGRYFVVPSCWKHGDVTGNGVTFQINDDSDIRLDLQAAS